MAADADDLLTSAFGDAPTAPIDLYQAYARPLPSRTAARFFGLPLSDAPLFSSWSLAFITVQVPGLPDDVYARALTQLAEFDDYVRTLVTGDLQGLQEGIVMTLARGWRAGTHDLTEDELVGNLANVLFAGHETTVSTLSNMILRLVRDGSLRSRLDEDTAEPDSGSVDDRASHRPARAPGSLSAQLMDEWLRLDTSVVGLFRSARADTTLAGIEIPAGAAIWAAFGAANRDPAAYAHPDILDTTRPPAQAPLTFGTGIHVCVGAFLARSQIEIALTTLHRRFPTLTLVSDPPEVPNHLLRITPTLPVTLG